MERGNHWEGPTTGRADGGRGELQRRLRSRSCLWGPLHREVSPMGSRLSGSRLSVEPSPASHGDSQTNAQFSSATFGIPCFGPGFVWFQPKPDPEPSTVGCPFSSSPTHANVLSKQKSTLAVAKIFFEVSGISFQLILRVFARLNDSPGTISAEMFLVRLGGTRIITACIAVACLLDFVESFG